MKKNEKIFLILKNGKRVSARTDSSIESLKEDLFYEMSPEDQSQYEIVPLPKMDAVHLKEAMKKAIDEINYTYENFCNQLASEIDPNYSEKDLKEEFDSFIYEARASFSIHAFEALKNTKMYKQY